MICSEILLLVSAIFQAICGFVNELYAQWKPAVTENRLPGEAERRKEKENENENENETKEFQSKTAK